MTGLNNKELTTSLEKHYDCKIEDLEKLMLSKFEGIREAILKSDAYAAYRDTKQNEFRGALDDVNERLADQAKGFATKEDVENSKKMFDIWMSGVKQLQEANFGVSMDAIRTVRDDVEKLKNVKEGSSSVWPWVISIVMSVIAVVSFILNITK